MANLDVLLPQEEIHEGAGGLPPPQLQARLAIVKSDLVAMYAQFYVEEANDPYQGNYQARFSTLIPIVKLHILSSWTKV